jgi:hypothetical protein
MYRGFHTTMPMSTCMCDEDEAQTQIEAIRHVYLPIIVDVQVKPFVVMECSEGSVAVAAGVLLCTTDIYSGHMLTGGKLEHKSRLNTTFHRRCLRTRVRCRYHTQILVYHCVR